MKLNKQKDGTLYIVANSPLLIYDNMNNSRIACELDEARLFVLTTKNSSTGAVEADVRLHTIEDDLDLARKRELEYLQIPVRYLRNEPEINEVYIGRYRVCIVPRIGRRCWKVVRHSRKIVFQLAEVAVPRELFQTILERIGRLRSPAAATG